MFEEESFAIRGAIYEVYKSLGSGFLEAVYQEALELELTTRHIPFKAQFDIGIAPQDLPRIFDQGYTGLNGREDKQASGLGLYLCRRVCRNLGHGISVQSRPGQGTTVLLDLSRKRFAME